MPTGRQGPTGPKPAAVGGSTTVMSGVVVDYQTVPLLSQEGQPAAGIAQVQTVTVPSGCGYRIERLDLWSDSQNASTVNLYIGTNPAPQNEIDFSLDGNHDVGDLNQAIYVPAGSTLLIQWSGLSTGAQVAARVQYAVVQFIPRTFG